MAKKVTPEEALKLCESDIDVNFKDHSKHVYQSVVCYTQGGVDRGVMPSCYGWAGDIKHMGVITRPTIKYNGETDLDLFNTYGKQFISFILNESWCKDSFLIKDPDYIEKYGYAFNTEAEALQTWYAMLWVRSIYEHSNLLFYNRFTKDVKYIWENFPPLFAYYFIMQTFLSSKYFNGNKHGYVTQGWTSLSKFVSQEPNSKLFTNKPFHSMSPSMIADHVGRKVTNYAGSAQEVFSDLETKRYRNWGDPHGMFFKFSWRKLSFSPDWGKMKPIERATHLFNNKEEWW